MGGQTHIAVVDDHTMVGKGLVHLINMFPNYKVLHEAGHGGDLITQLRPADLPDIVLLYISMPVMDGYATAAWMAANHPGVKIVALSTIKGEAAIVRMIRNGARGYILKDADPGELKNAFDAVLSLGYYYNNFISRKIISSVSQLPADSKLSILVKLTDREMEFIKLACSEKTYFEIAKEMYLSEKTIDGYRESLFKKLNVSSRVGLVLYAIKNELVKI